MKNPLNRRVWKELKSDMGKYAVIFFFVAAAISLVSGFLVADNSLLIAYDESFETYNIEHGNFELAQKADDALIETLEETENLTVYPNYYIEEETKEVDSTLRIFINREEVNKACLMDGKMPSTDREIAIDRMYADNNDLTVGDTLTVGGEELTVTGLVALSDYSALFSDNSDMMFDSIKFGVAVMTSDGFDTFGDTHLHYSYSWKYDTEPKDDADAKEKGDALLKLLVSNAVVQEFTPQYTNQAILFTGDDMGGDKAMFTVFLYIVIAIIAFVFAITTSNTIAKEASVIGTLRASGYTRGEILRHYMAMPLIVTTAAAVIGNVLGYTVFKDYFADMYYGSYSLPTYETRWNAEAFVLTTVVPFVIMLVINFCILRKKLKLSPLKFLRHDLSTRQKKKAFRLNTKIRFFTRFKIRIIFQNIPNYVTMFVGVFFASFILFFGFMFGPLLNEYQEDICSHLICDNQYVLKAPMETDTQDAEKYAVSTYLTDSGKYQGEDVMVYGIDENSRYVELPDGWSGVYVSNAYAEKFKLKKGDRIAIKDEFGDDTYEFEVAGTYYYPSAIAVFMSKDDFNETFDKEDGYFNGYFSDEEITDIDDAFIATVITQDDLTKVSRQLDRSMGNMMNLFIGFGVVMFMLLIYLLSKQVIEKNAQSISMTKILGYSNGEIGNLYIMSTTIVTILALLISMPICYYGMKAVFETALADMMSGYIPYYIDPTIYIKMLLLGIASYAVVSILQLLKINRIPKGDALKNVE